LLELVEQVSQRIKQGRMGVLLPAGGLGQFHGKQPGMKGRRLTLF